MSDALATDSATATPGYVLRPATDADWPALWAVVEPMIRDGGTYPIEQDASEADARAYWLAPEKRTFVADDPVQGIIGCYYLKPNSTGPAAHVCNAGYVVRPDQRGRGVAQALCRHSFETARAEGYRAMQYNLVIATNERAVRLWQHMGLAIVGTLPGAFRHPTLGYVDAYVMFRSLLDD